MFNQINSQVSADGRDEDTVKRVDSINFEDHPADKQIDYNSVIDFLEEEHLRRDVFTTTAAANETIIPNSN